MTVREQLESKYGTVAPVSPQKSTGSVRASLEAKYNQPEPTLGGQIVRGIAKPFVRAGLNIAAIPKMARGVPQEQIDKGFNSKYFGQVKPVGVSGNFAKDVLDSFGVGADIASNLIGGGGATSVVKQGLKGAIKQGIKTGAKSGLASGATYGLGAGLQEQEGKTTKEILGDTALSALKGGATGIVTGGAFGLASPMVTRFIPKSPQVRSDKVDKQIRNIFRGTTGDITKLDTSAFKARKGLELLQKNSKEILIPDSNSPLGSNLVKPFDLQKSTPNELLSSVLEMDKKIVNVAREATEKAKNAGLKIDTSSAEQIIRDSVERGDIAKATGERLVKQIKNTGNDPVKIHDWIQDVNVKYKKKYERGTIEDTSIGKVADDIAEDMRSKLDSIIDRKGYAEAFGNNQELKRMLIAIAKKANRKVNFGDITTDAGLDLGISILTGNPAYMARTVGSGLFRGLISRFRNTQGLRDFRSAAKGVTGLPTNTKLPSTELKGQSERLLLPQGPIILNDPRQFNSNGTLRASEVQSFTAQKNPVSVNPKTGRLQTTYNSQSSNVIAPKTSQIAIKTKDIIPPKKLDNISAPKTTQKQVSSDISKTIPLSKKKSTSSRNAGFISVGGYKGEKNLTTKILKDLEGKTTVSKQYILDATNRGELKQVERDITREVLDTMKGDTINVKEFADKVKSELLPLKRGAMDEISPKYESITLSDDLRGDVANYSEHVYQSPIKTSAGDIHFRDEGESPSNYFGHTRIEDMADNKTRRVIEVQSDLYQKGNLERELKPNNHVNGLSDANAKKYLSDTEYKEFRKTFSGSAFGNAKSQLAHERHLELAKITGERMNVENTSNLSKLQQYNDPTAHFRMIREEIKKAAQDGKTKLQFPTGETAMKIEGLGENADNWLLLNKNNQRLKTDSLKVGEPIARVGSQDSWIITDVLGDGKFKAVQKNFQGKVGGEYKTWFEMTPEQQKVWETTAVEQFDISGKVDTNNPIYKFYEKDVQKYLNKFGGKRVVDDKGVSWIEVPITKEQGKAPVEAFGKAQPNVVMIGALGSAGTVAGLVINKKNKEKKQINFPRK